MTTADGYSDDTRIDSSSFSTLWKMGVFIAGLLSVLKSEILNRLFASYEI